MQVGMPVIHIADCGVSLEKNVFRAIEAQEIDDHSQVLANLDITDVDIMLDG
mgnify:CR=1 FL=1